ncbi:TetR family transcriptional regulator [Streptomyces sp. NPDC018693]|uniref:TetR family transcriptional regulator n=1 Tax=unclassified Streptomyces TaxID=2593676 RepID=UPI00378E2799
MNTRPKASLAQRKRQLVTEELMEAALQLLARRGFDAVTIDEIAAAAGASKRTFFRYFASKEDVVVQFLSGMGEQMSAELAGRPAGERPSVAMRHTVQVPLAACADRSDHAERALRVVQLILRTPSLRARFLEHQAQWRDALAEQLAPRLAPGPDTELRARLAAGVVLTAFDTVLGQWSDSDGTADMTALVDRVFTVLAPALDGGR